MGLQNGIEKISKVMMSALLIIMVILAVHSVMMEGAGEGISFYLIPDFQKIKEAGVGNVVFAALSQSFFTLSIGIEMCIRDSDTVDTYVDMCFSDDVDSEEWDLNEFNGVLTPIIPIRPDVYKRQV